MGEVRFFRAVQGGREWVFAFLDGPDAVWGMDRLTGEEWWYEESVAGWLAPVIRSRLASGVPIPEVAVDAAGPAALAGAPARYDLALHEPGHAVLAAIHQRLVPLGPGAPVPADVDPWCEAYVAELDVSAALDRLSSRWRVLHSVPVAAHVGADVDHVVIGPGGVFTLTSIGLRGRTLRVDGDGVDVDGVPVDLLGEARGQAQRAVSALSADPELAASVFPTVVVASGRLVVGRPPELGYVTDLDGLVDWLHSVPVRLTQAQVVTAYDVLRWAEAWTDAPPPDAAPAATAELARSRGRAAGTSSAPSAAPEQEGRPAGVGRRARAVEPASRSRRAGTSRRSVLGEGLAAALDWARTPRGRTLLAVAATVLLVLLVAPGIVAGLQRAASDAIAGASDDPLPVSTVAPDVGGPCAPPDQALAPDGTVIACNRADGTWVVRGVDGPTGKACTTQDQLGWDTARNKPTVCALDPTTLVWSPRPSTTGG